MAKDPVVDVDNTQDYAFIMATLSTLQQLVMEYYLAGSNDPKDQDNRHVRAIAIRDAIGKIDLPIVIGSPETLGDDNYGCPLGTDCIGGICIIPNGIPVSFKD